MDLIYAHFVVLGIKNVGEESAIDVAPATCPCPQVVEKRLRHHRRWGTSGINEAKVATRGVVAAQAGVD